MDQSWLSVSDAAEVLSLSHRRVRSMLESGELRGQKMGGVWFVDPLDVRRRGAFERMPGRPLSASNAWVYLAALSGALESRHVGAEDRYSLCEQSAASLIRNAVDRSRLRSLLKQIPDAAGLARLLRSRADVRRMRVHPGVLERLLSDDRVSVGAGRAVAAMVGGVADGGQPRIYVREAAMDALTRKYRLVEDANGNVDVALIAAVVPDAALPRLGHPVPEAVAWLDILDDPDSRARHAAGEWVASLPTGIEVADGRRGR